MLSDPSMPDCPVVSVVGCTAITGYDESAILGSNVVFSPGVRNSNHAMRLEAYTQTLCLEVSASGPPGNLEYGTANYPRRDFEFATLNVVRADAEELRILLLLARFGRSRLGLLGIMLPISKGEDDNAALGRLLRLLVAVSSSDPIRTAFEMPFWLRSKEMLLAAVADAQGRVKGSGEGEKVNRESTFVGTETVKANLAKARAKENRKAELSLLLRRKLVDHTSQFYQSWSIILS
jgi:hypothetical protein